MGLVESLQGKSKLKAFTTVRAASNYPGSRLGKTMPRMMWDVKDEFNVSLCTPSVRPAGDSNPSLTASFTGSLCTPQHRSAITDCTFRDSDISIVGRRPG